MVLVGPGATIAAERPEPTEGGLSLRWREQEFSAERQFLPSAGGRRQVGGETPAERDFGGGKKLRLTISHTGRRARRRPREMR